MAARISREYSVNRKAEHVNASSDETISSGAVRSERCGEAQPGNDVYPSWVAARLPAIQHIDAGTDVDVEKTANSTMQQPHEPNSIGGSLTAGEANGIDQSTDVPTTFPPEYLSSDQSHDVADKETDDNIVTGAATNSDKQAARSSEHLPPALTQPFERAMSADFLKSLNISTEEVPAWTAALLPGKYHCYTL